MFPDAPRGRFQVAAVGARGSSQLAWRREASLAEVLGVDFAVVVELGDHVGAEHHVAQLAEMIRVGQHDALRELEKVRGQRLKNTNPGAGADLGSRGASAPVLSSHGLQPLGLEQQHGLTHVAVVVGEEALEEPLRPPGPCVAERHVTAEPQRINMIIKGF
ncbi:hypothetical protein EYF80_040435 [Liparis tanakae]|uniref:Uncharacterized protein n=1 Tax=Liparis tanakae TaxID=230148 RepID=A0A4Z2G980_9TELE|nr:hypothetical protein EYF80_040435 [Liparis tanakae]